MFTREWLSLSSTVQDFPGDPERIPELMEVLEYSHFLIQGIIFETSGNDFSGIRVALKTRKL